MEHTNTLNTKNTHTQTNTYRRTQTHIHKYLKLDPVAGEADPCVPLAHAVTQHVLHLPGIS